MIQPQAVFSTASCGRVSLGHTHQRTWAVLTVDTYSMSMSSSSENTRSSNGPACARLSTSVLADSISLPFDRVCATHESMVVQMREWDWRLFDERDGLKYHDT